MSTGHTKKMKEAIHNTCKQVFEEYDIQKRGIVEKTHISHMLEKITNAFGLHRPSEEDIKDGFAELDTSNDHFLTHAEFDTLVAAILSNMC